jgi:integrase
LEGCRQKNKPRTVSDYARLLNRHFPFGRRQLSDIATKDIIQRIDRLAPTPSEQMYALVVIKILFNWALSRRYIEHNPCAGLKKSKQVTKDRVLSDAELSAVWRAAEAAASPFGTIVRLLILTGQRRGEIAALRWEWIDRNSNTISLPAVITKNSRPHTFPYGTLTVRSFETIPKLGDALFPARGNSDTCFYGWSKCKRALDTKCKTQPWTLHDLRRTFATNLAALNVAPHVVEKLLNYATGTISGIAAIYNKFQYVDEMRAAIAAWETRLASLLKS